MTKLVKIHVSKKLPSTHIASKNKWVQTFKKAANDEAAPSVAKFAYNVAEYLNFGEGSGLYEECYQLELDNKSLKRRTDAISANTRKAMRLNEARILNEEAKEELYMGTTGTSTISPGTASSTSASTGTPVTTTLDKRFKKVSILKHIFNDAKKLHIKYKNEECLNNMELKRISIGLSGTFDCMNDDQAQAFGNDDFYYVRNKFKVKYCMKVPEGKPVDWAEVVNKCKTKGLKYGHRYLDSLCAADTVPNVSYRTYKFYDAILDAVQNCQHTLNPPAGPNKLTEGDYNYQVWFPVLKKLFDINGEESNIRLKVCESVTKDSTEEKSTIYDEFSNTVGFKIDIRCLFDLRNQEVDLCCAEVCLPNAGKNKVVGDISKLLREGRVNTSSLLSLCSNDSSDKYTWICQICGLQAFFSTIVYVGNDLFTSVYQFIVPFPTCINELEYLKESISKLMFFKNDVESICEILKPARNSIKMNNNTAFQYYSSNSDGFTTLHFTLLPRLQH